MCWCWYSRNNRSEKRLFIMQTGIRGIFRMSTAGPFNIKLVGSFDYLKCVLVSTTHTSGVFSRLNILLQSCFPLRDKRMIIMFRNCINLSLKPPWHILDYGFHFGNGRTLLTAMSNLSIMLNLHLILIQTTGILEWLWFHVEL